MEDSARAWANSPPVIGTALSLSIGYQGQSLVSCGNFEVDEWEAEGPPDTFLIRAIQAGVTHAIRTPKSVSLMKARLLLDSTNYRRRSMG